MLGRVNVEKLMTESGKPPKPFTPKPEPTPPVPGTRRARRGRRGRPTTTTETVTEETKSIIEMVHVKDPVMVEQALTRRTNTLLNNELELLASHVLSDPSFDDVSMPEVMGPLYRGDGVSALKALCSRMRRRFAKLLRDHQTMDEFTQ